MKVLQINCVYKKGSTGKIVNDLHEYYLQKGIDSFVCYGRGEKVQDVKIYKISNEIYSKANNLLSRFTGLMYGGCILSTLQLLSVINSISPDIVHLHCINGYFVNIYKIIEWLKKKNIKTILTLHAEFMYTGNCGYALECEKWKTGCGKCPRLFQETKSIFLDNTNLSWNMMKKAFEGYKSENLEVISVSPWLCNRSIESPILGDKNNSVILNGIDTTVFSKKDINEELVKQYGLVNGKTILHVTSAFSSDENHIKGGYYIIQFAKKLYELDKEIKILVAGNIVKVSEEVPNIIYLGSVAKKEDLAMLYNIADITLITSKKETFSMIVAESLCCGTPVIGFKAGAPEQITIPEYSVFVDQGDLYGLLTQYEKFSRFDEEQRNQIALAARGKYSVEEMGRKYIEKYREILCIK